MPKVSKNKSIAITGATGFVGAHFVRHFYKKGYQVVAIGRQNQPPKNLSKFATWLKADITKPMPAITTDVVIHCAGLASDKGTYDDYYITNELGTKHVFEACKEACKMIYISSASVYAYCSTPLTEDSPTVSRESNYYGFTKRQAEIFLERNANEQKRVTILRPRAIYGTHDRVLLPRILNLVKGDKAWLPGHLEYKASMTSIHNLIHAVELSISNDQDFAIYNVADDEVYALKEVIEQLLKVAYSDLKFYKLPIKPLYFLANIFNKLNINSNISKQSLDYLSHDHVLNLDKIKTELGYESRSNFSIELDKMKAWINKVGVNRARKGDVNLPWTHV